METMYPAIVNSPATTLASDISSTDTTIPLVDASVLPDAPNIAVIGHPLDVNRETILYAGKSGNNLTGCTRGFQGTARSWDAGLPVARYFTAYDHDTFINNINEVNSSLSSHVSANSGVHGVGTNYVAQAPSSGHLVRSFTKGWTSNKRLKGGGVNADPTEFDDVIGINFIIDGGGNAITTGLKGYLEIPFDCTITGWTILSDVTGSIVVDVKKATYSDFPTTSSIAGTEKPTLSSARKNQDLELTTWSTSISAGDILEFVVNSASTVTIVTVSLRAIKS